METNETNNSRLITIVVPIYLSANYIENAVLSLVNQTYKNIEIVLVNDGSPDNSGDICDKLSKMHSNIIVIHQNNQGAAHAMYNGACHGRGRYLMFMDADDWLESNTCELAIKAMLEHKCDLVFWYFYKEFDNKSVKVELPFSNEVIFVDETIKYLQRRLIGLEKYELKNPTKTDALSSGWAKLFIRENLVKNKQALISQDGHDHFDVILNITMVNLISKAVFLPYHLNHYRQYNPNSLSKNHGFSLFLKYKIMFNSILELIDENGVNKNLINALNNRIALSLINICLSITSKRNTSSIFDKITHLKMVLDDDIYRKSITMLEIKYLPIHWRFFYKIAKSRNATLLFLVSLIMNKLR